MSFFSAVCNRCGETLATMPAAAHVGSTVFLEHEKVCPHVGAELDRLRAMRRGLVEWRSYLRDDSDEARRVDKLLEIAPT